MRLWTTAAATNSWCEHGRRQSWWPTSWPDQRKKLYMQSCVMANKLATGTSKEVFWPTSWPSFFAWVVAAKEDESARCLAGCCRINAFHGYVGPPRHAFCFVAMLQMHDHKSFLSSSPLCLQDGGSKPYSGTFLIPVCTSGSTRIFFPSCRKGMVSTKSFINRGC